MMRKLLWLLPLMFTSLVWGPPPTQESVRIVSAAPSGQCQVNWVAMVKKSGVEGGDLYGCLGNQWARLPVGVNELSATNAGSAGLCLSVSATDATKFEFVACGSGGGGGTSTIKEGGSTVVSSATILNFGSGFAISPSTTVSTNDTANVALDYAENKVPLTTGVVGELPLANGGTGANTDVQARSNLGLVIGTHVQGFDEELAEIAVVAPGINEILKYNGTAWAAAPDSTGSTPSFDTVASGTNTSATMNCGVGCTIVSTGGSITATAIPGSGVSGNILGNAANVTGVVAIANGGTNIGNYAQGDILFASVANTLAALSKNTTATRYLSNTGANNNPAWAQVDLSNGVTNTLPFANGGFGFATSAQGDLFFSASANTISKLTKDTNATRYLSNTGTTNNPAWAQINLTNGVTGVLPFANNGGFGFATANSGGIPYFSSSTSVASSGLLGLNGIVAGGGAGGAPFTSATTINAAGSIVVPTGQTIDIAADATNGGALVLKEPSSIGTDLWTLKVPNTGITGPATVTINANGSIPADKVGQATASRCARFDANGLLIAAGGDCAAGDTTGEGFADPGGNGIVVRNALNTSIARAVTGTSLDISVANGDGVAGAPTLTLDRTATLAGNPTLAASHAAFATTGLIFEGTADAIETLLTAADPTGSDKTVTIPNETGTVCTSGATPAGGALCTLYAPVASPTLTGNPIGPTAAPGDNDTSLATTAFVAAALTARVETASFAIANPGTGDSAKAQVQLPNASTITRISCSTDTGTVTANVNKRAEATPNTAGTDVLSAGIVCDNTSQTSCSAGCDVNTITSASVTARQLLALTISATASSPTAVRFHIEYTMP